MKNLEFKINDNITNRLSDLLDLNKNILITGKDGVGKTTLLKKIIGEISEENREIYIVSEFKDEFIKDDDIFNNSRVKAMLDPVESIDILKEVYRKNEVKKNKITIIIDNLFKYLNENKDNIRIANKIALGSLDGINVISSRRWRDDIPSIIKDKYLIKYSFDGIGCIIVKNRYLLNF